MRGYLENESDAIKSGKSKLSETFMYDCYFSFQFTHFLLALNVRKMKPEQHYCIRTLEYIMA